MRRKTLGEMRRSVQQFIRDSSAQTAKLIDEELNAAYEEIAGGRDWLELRGFINESFTFTANESYLALPEDAQDLVSLSNKTTDYELTRVPLATLMHDHVHQLDTAGSTVLHYSVLGYMATRRPMSQDDEVAIRSESVNDANVSVRVRGLRAAPEIEDTETIKTHATTPTSTKVAGVHDYRAGWSIKSISVNQPLNGFIEVTENQSGNILAYVTEHHRESQYLILRFQNPPSGADQLALVYKKRITPLSSSDDVTVIAAAEAIEEMTIAQMRRMKEQYMQAREHRTEADRKLTTAFTAQHGSKRERMQARPDRRFRAPFRGY